MQEIVTRDLLGIPLLVAGHPELRSDRIQSFAYHAKFHRPRYDRSRSRRRIVALSVCTHLSKTFSVEMNPRCESIRIWGVFDAPFADLVTR
jgi:hypothetical protein